MESCSRSGRHVWRPPSLELPFQHATTTPSRTSSSTSASGARGSKYCTSFCVLVCLFVCACACGPFICETRGRRALVLHRDHNVLYLRSRTFPRPHSHRFKRHSKSIDVTTTRCGCSGSLKLLPRQNADGTPAKARQLTKYTKFVKVREMSECTRGQVVVV